MKKIAFMAAVAVAASAALPSRVCAETGTDVLMWYLDLGTSPAEGVKNQTIDSLSFYLRATDDHSVTISLNEHTYIEMDDVGTGNGAGTAAGIDGNLAGVYHTDLSGAGDIDYSKYEFMLAAYNGGELVAWSAVLFDPNSEDHVMLSDLAGSLYSLSNGGDLNPMPSPDAIAFDFGPHVVPEPSSGLMILVGGALLALRRRRKNT